MPYKDRVDQILAEQRYRAKNPDRDRLYYLAHHDEIRQRRNQKYAAGAEERQQKRMEKHRLAVLHRRERDQHRYATRQQAPIGSVDLGAIIIRDKRKCRICGKTVKRGQESFDHIIPLSAGGQHTQKNLQLTHKSCNFSRGAGRIPAQTRLLG